MITDIVIGSIANWVQRHVGRYAFRKTRLRFRFKDKLQEIVDDFADAMADRGKTCSLVSVISEAIPADTSRNGRVHCQLRVAQLLGKWFSEYRGSSNSVMPTDISGSFDQFARILYETHSVFREFLQVIGTDETICNRLKNDSSRYPYFEKIYNKTTADFEALCREARKTLGDEFRDHQFTPLPRL